MIRFTFQVYTQINKDAIFQGLNPGPQKMHEEIKQSPLSNKNFIRMQDLNSKDENLSSVSLNRNEVNTESLDYLK